ncbi:MAG: PQQ-dependent sugar dehydrogenase [Rhodococcus sp. (in: high G+C Gram-positive bacteria)]
MCLTIACSTGAVAQPSPSLPKLEVTVEFDGLTKPWDVVQAPDGTILTGERSGRFVVKRPGMDAADVAADLSDLYAEGETGLMGIALANDFEQSRALYTCQGVLGGGSGAPGTGSADPGSAGGGGSNSIAVFRWTVDENWQTLTRERAVVENIPVADNGRHGGCRILVAPDDTLFVGTGDTARPTVPQDRNSLGGKVLHVNPDGTAAADAPGRVYTLGHRNVQGLAYRPGSNQLYEVEQGPDRDDEFNLLTAGGNYGWKPDRTPVIYDESVPMTDPARVPGAIGAVWSSGDSPAIATPGLTFVDGAQWGEWDGAAVISSQQREKLVFLRLNADGTAVEDEVSALEGAEGRLRSLTSTGDGTFLLTTDNGNGQDKVLRVTAGA